MDAFNVQDLCNRVDEVMRQGEAGALAAAHVPLVDYGKDELHHEVDQFDK